MTTNNHSAVALSVALLTQNANTIEKAGILSALVLSHVVCDAIPHSHYYSFIRLKETIKGAVFELGIGLIGMTLCVALLTQANLVWLFSCVIAASLLDFLVALNVGFVNKINCIIHWWETSDYPMRTKWQWEIYQTVFLTAILAMSIIRFG